MLAGCINDCNDMRDLAAGMGFRTRQLIDAAATSGAVVAAIDRRREDAERAGDILLLTYSGHGSQVPDTMAEETDQLDETWVLWDRQLLDDELYDLWCRFAAGVRILLISDSCHSGTVSRAVDMATAQVAAAYAGAPESRGLTNGSAADAERHGPAGPVGPAGRGRGAHPRTTSSAAGSRAFGATSARRRGRAAIRGPLGTMRRRTARRHAGLGPDRPRRLAPSLACRT